MGRLLTSDQTRGATPRQLLDELECLLEEAEAMLPESIPDDVVTMNSTVLLISVNSTAEITCTVVYPEDIDLVDDGVSVLEPLGTRLIGCEVGVLVDCEIQKDRGLWRVAKILFQPERVGAFHL
ncbi:MAG: GreA/GreB family elongation factor [Planctomycetota bacterium]